MRARTNPLFYSLHCRSRFPNKNAKIINLLSQDLPLCWNAKQDLPAAQVLNYRTCIIDRNLNKHVYISTNSTNRVQVNFAFTCDGHVIDICTAPASETGMMKCLHLREFHGHIWKQVMQNISLRLRTTWQAPSYLIWRLLSFRFLLWHCMAWEIDLTRHISCKSSDLIGWQSRSNQSHAIASSYFNSHPRYDML